MQAMTMNPAAMSGTIVQGIGLPPGTQAAAGEDFNAVLAQMMGEGVGGQAMFGQLSPELLEQLQGKDQREITSDYAMQLMASMFMGAPTELSVDLSPSPMAYKGDAAMAAAQTTQLNAESLQAAQALLTADDNSQWLSQPGIADVLLGSGTQSTANGSPWQTAATQQPVAALLAEAEALTEAGQGATAHQNPNNPLNETAKALGAQVQTSTADPLDSAQSAYLRMARNAARPRMQQAEEGDALAQLQAAAGQQTTETTQLIRTPAQKLADQAIFSQVREGIQQNLAKGDSEFTIKLRPEGLGEITVKLVEQDGKIALSIITSSAQAQNALSSQIGALREALRPMNAEISQVISQQAQDFQQSMGEHQQQQQQQNRHAATTLWQEETTSPQQQLQYAQALSSALNAYI